MILTVTLNPAWDVTYTVDALRPGDSHRVLAAGQAGGKGVNVSRVLAQMGHATLATGLAGGPAGEALTADLAMAGVASAFVHLGQPTRNTVTVVDGAGEATVLSETGPHLDRAGWRTALFHLGPLVADADLVVLAGSLPPGAPTGAYEQLAALARRAGRPCLVDADGPALAAVFAAAPDLVKPNRAELLRATGSHDLPSAIDACLAAGAGRLVVTDGPAGMTGVGPAGAWRATPPPITPANPTGAGDAATAALAVGLLAGDDWPALLRRATAWSAAAALHPRAGRLAADRVPGLAAGTTVEQVRTRAGQEHAC